jgi:YD repeat-containing protein
MIALEIPGRGIPYRFEMNYHSRINYNGPLGRNWEHGYNKRLVRHPGNANQIVYYNGKGRGDAFQELSDGTFIAPVGQFSKMVKDAQGFFLLRNRKGTIYKFLPLDNSASAGKLSAVISRCGDRLTLEYDTEGRMVRLLDTLSRPIVNEYDSKGRLTTIRDFANREVVFTYNDSDQLIAVRSPVIVNTPNNQNDYPQGKVWRFTYSQGFGDNRRNHNIISVIAPNDSGNQAVPHIVNSYDSDDRLISVHSRLL